MQNLTYTHTILVHMLTSNGRENMYIQMYIYVRTACMCVYVCMALFANALLHMPMPGLLAHQSWPPLPGLVVAQANLHHE